MIKLFEDKSMCCGCTACISICTAKAITMLEDKEGFLYPEINSELCINCGLCKRVCPIQNEIKIEDRFETPLVYALKHKEDDVRMTSSSGGAYTAISDYALSLSSSIYGAEFNEDFTVQHKREKTRAGRNKFKGSKYVKSYMGNVFEQVRDDLSQDKGVLFTGTPCEIAGLRKYLEATKVKMNKLILNDIICHGTPSPKIWKEYLNFIQNKSNIKNYTFRAKEKGWHGYNIKVEFENGKSKLNTADLKVFVNLFSADLVLRPSCYKCKFSNINRPSDIMIGDFWGIEKFSTQFDDNKGVSLVFVNTSKGKDIFNEIKKDTDFVQSSPKDCLQKNLQYPTELPNNREEFWNDYEKFGFLYISKKYGEYNYKGRIKRAILNLLQKIGMLDVVKKLLR